MTAIPGKDLQLQLLEAMGLPAKRAVEVAIDMSAGGCATVSVAYLLTAKALAVLGDAYADGLDPAASAEDGLTEDGITIAERDQSQSLG